MIPKVSPVKVIGYVRVSKVGSRGGERFRSPKEQHDAISALAEERGFEVFRWLEELDASGGDEKRPRWNEARRAVERGEAAGVMVYDFSRWSRDTERGLASIKIMREAGGDLWSCQERIDTTTPEGWFMLTSFLANATLQREMAGRRFRAAAESAVVRGVYMAGRVPLGYVRDAERHLAPDPETRDLVVGAFERRAKGWSWVRLARWLADQGHAMSESGVRGLVSNRAYLGEARYGAKVAEGAHPAIVPRALFRKCQVPGRKSARDGRLTERYLLQGLAMCASCGRVLYLSGGRRTKDYAHYICRRLECIDHAYARAGQLDNFVLNRIEELLTGGDYDGVRVGEGDEARWREATYIPRPGSDGAEVAEAENALAEAREDLDEFLSNTKLRRVLGAAKHTEAAENYVAVVEKCEADLAAARGRDTGSWALVGELWWREWGWAERREWLERVLSSVVVLRGREPLSRRVEVELR